MDWNNRTSSATGPAGTNGTNGTNGINGTNGVTTYTMLNTATTWTWNATQYQSEATINVSTSVLTQSIVDSGAVMLYEQVPSSSLGEQCLMR